MPVTTPPAFDALPAADAAAQLAPCCASVHWQQAVVAGRPYGGRYGLVAASDAALAELGWDDVLAALAAHPRIGQRASGDDVESQWSRAEQSAAATADADVTARLRAGNVAYEERFGWVFLVCATGLAPEQVLAALTARRGNDDATERVEVREQLRLIVRLRLAKAFGGEE